MNAGLFEALPEFPVALPADELSLLAQLADCDWPTNQAIDDSEHAAARRLERRGLIKISRQKDDPVAIYPTWYVGRLPASSIRALTSSQGDAQPSPSGGTSNG